MINFFGKELNEEEMFVGACSQLPMFLFVEYWAIPMALIASVLWPLGGTKDAWKAWRRVGVPLMTGCVLAWIFCDWTMLLGIPLGFAALTIGYGHPDYRPSTYDEGSVLGRFWYKILNGDEVDTTIATRSTVIVLMWVGLLLPLCGF